MKCERCGSSDFDMPAEKSALEILRCKECGDELAVHCHYLMDLPGMPKYDLFIGTASIQPGFDALKSLFKLKKALAFAERFEPAKLEAQHKAGSLTWDLGYFLDFEVAQAEAECLRSGISAVFHKAE